MMTRIFTILFAAASRAAVGVSEPVICRDDDEWRLEGGDVPSGVARTSSSRTLTAAPAAAPFSCAWVAENSTSRCGAVSERDASDACAKTCGYGNADSATWYRKKPSKDCAWVGEDPLETTTRCAKGGTDPAIAACAAATIADRTGANLSIVGTDVTVAATSVQQLRHHFGPFLTHFPALSAPYAPGDMP